MEPICYKAKAIDDNTTKGSGVSRARAVKQLAAEGLLSRAKADRVNRRVKVEY
ncbi:MAG: hypothetical protein OXF23_06125 [Candidatus Dadabacteria bacterium]|nr:hypothetical protein [Candidatus Dadabacteria bacterium]